MVNLNLIYSIVAILALVYFKNQLSIPQPFFYFALSVIILIVLSTRQTLINENFESDASSQKEVRYGDIISLWGWTNQFVNITPNNNAGVSARFSKPEDMPRVGMVWEFMVIEDPKETNIGFNNNNNPIKYGDRILLRSTYKLGWLGINPTPNNQSIIITENRNEWIQFQLISNDPSLKMGQSVKYGDQLYLKTFQTPTTYLSVTENGSVLQSKIQDTKSLFTILDRYGQGNLIDWARKGTAEQSSIFGNYIPNNAIDANILTFNHTQNDDNPWWQVILPRDIAIDKIVVNNRRDCCQNRLTNFDISILDQNYTQIATRHFDSADPFATWTNVNQIGRIVKVQLKSKNYLHMSEVNVYGNAVNYSSLLEKPLSVDLLNEPKSYSANKSNDDQTNYMIINSNDLPYNTQSKSVSLSMFIKLLKTNPNETTILYKGINNSEKCPAITVLPNSTRLRMYYATAQSTNQFFDSNLNLPLNQWTHIVYIIDAGVNINTGWQISSFTNRLSQAPYEPCCYYINPLTQQYYYSPNNSTIKVNQNNILDPSAIQTMKYMGQLQNSQTKPRAMIYINGVLQNTVEMNDTPKLNTGPLIIGKSQNSGMNSSDFVIDQIKYFNYAITSQQVKQLTLLPLYGITKTLINKASDTLNIVKFQPNELPHLENDFTVNFWIFSKRSPNGTGNYDTIFFKGNQPSDKSPSMSFLPLNNRFNAYIRTNNTSYPTGEGISSSNYVLPTNQWHHIALTLQNKIQTLYIDGQKTNQITLSNTPVYTDSPMNIGGFDGQMINFQLSNFSMTPEQIILAMGNHPNEPYNQIIKQIWTNTGCLTNPVPNNEPNKYPEWINLIKNNSQTQVQNQILNIKNKADKGDKQMQQLCYGQFTAGMLDKLAEKDQLIQYTLQQQKQGIKCLPIAPFNCPQKNINDFDIKTHKDFNKLCTSNQNSLNYQPIENHPSYNDLVQKLLTTNGVNGLPKHVRCWGCQLPN